MWSLRHNTGLGVAEAAPLRQRRWRVCCGTPAPFLRRVIQMYAFNTGPSRVRAELAACKALASSRKRHAVVRVASGSFVVRSEQWDKNWGSKKSFLEVAVAAPARVIVVSSSPLRRVALRDAMRALSCAPHAIAATSEDTAADIAEERRGADDATMGGRATTPSRWGGGGEEVLEG